MLLYLLLFCMLTQLSTSRCQHELKAAKGIHIPVQVEFNVLDCVVLLQCSLFISFLHVLEEIFFLVLSMSINMDTALSRTVPVRINGHPILCVHCLFAYFLEACYKKTAQRVYVYFCCGNTHGREHFNKQNWRNTLNVLCMEKMAYCWLSPTWEISLGDHWFHGSVKTEKVGLSPDVLTLGRTEFPLRMRRLGSSCQWMREEKLTFSEQDSPRAWPLLLLLLLHSEGLRRPHPREDLCLKELWLSWLPSAA